MLLHKEYGLLQVFCAFAKTKSKLKSNTSDFLMAISGYILKLKHFSLPEKTATHYKYVFTLLYFNPWVAFSDQLMLDRKLDKRCRVIHLKLCQEVLTVRIDGCDTYK